MGSLSRFMCGIGEINSEALESCIYYLLNQPNYVNVNYPISDDYLKGYIEGITKTISTLMEQNIYLNKIERLNKGIATDERILRGEEWYRNRVKKIVKNLESLIQFKYTILNKSYDGKIRELIKDADGFCIYNKSEKRLITSDDCPSDFDSYSDCFKCVRPYLGYSVEDLYFMYYSYLLIEDGDIDTVVIAVDTSIDEEDKWFWQICPFGEELSEEEYKECNEVIHEVYFG